MENDYEIIKRYLKGELAGEELDAFNSRLTVDMPFRKLMETEETIYTSLLVLQQKKKFREEFSEGGKVISLMAWIKHPIAIAASVTLIVMAGYLIYSIRLTDQFIVPVYSANQSGFAGTEKLEDITVKIKKSSNGNHYIFGSELVISVNFTLEKENVEIVYDNEGEIYWLKLHNELYQLIKDNKTHPLK